MFNFMPLSVCRNSLLQPFSSYYFQALELFSEQQQQQQPKKKKSLKGLADCKMLVSVKLAVDPLEALSVRVGPLVQGREGTAKGR